jgi:hypothetical protein
MEEAQGEKTTIAAADDHLGGSDDDLTKDAATQQETSHSTDGTSSVSEMEASHNHSYDTDMEVDQDEVTAEADNEDSKMEVEATNQVGSIDPTVRANMHIRHDA